MKNFIKNYYSIGIIIAMIIGLTMWIQYNYFIATIKTEVENTIESRLDYMASEINGHIESNQKALEAVLNFILIETNEDKIIDFMQALMRINPTLQSIYFGSTDNHMMNGSGFIPPGNFDLRTRPWYIAALNENKHIITRPYLNASKDNWIVTLAKPVYDEQNRLLGVVAGDSLLESTLSMLEEQKISDKGYTFLLDRDRNVLLHPEYEKMTGLALSLSDLSADLSTELSKNRNGIILTSLDGVIGYVGWRTFEDSGWVIGSFAPMNDFVNQRLQNMTIFIITILSTVIILFVAFVLQKKYVINPIRALDIDIQKISEDTNFTYRLPVRTGDPFSELRVTTNKVLEKTEDFFKTMNEDQLRIEKLSYHDQLTGLYNRRFYEEEQRRLDVKRSLPLSVMMLDVNGLKLTNDAFGHLAGDQLLLNVAKVIKDHCREEDIIARIGGDEFIVLLPKTGITEAKNIADRIRKGACHQKMDNVVISVSIGCATKTNENQSISDIFIRAEDQMYREKLTESQSMRNKTIQVIIKTLNEKSAREKIHSDQVALLCHKMGKVMDVDAQTLNELVTAGHLHDIGKIAIRDEVLNKSGKLTEQEYEEIKKHSESGYLILKSVDAYSSLAEDILSHHERWDGQGYPRGLKGTDIPLIARIISVTDAYEAMISQRLYRATFNHKEAREELRKYAGTQFDPDVVKVFLEHNIGL